jgi:arylsulfatase A-like enzyme
MSTTFQKMVFSVFFVWASCFSLTYASTQFDYDGDGKADLAFRNIEQKSWYILKSSSQGLNLEQNSDIQRFKFGLENGDIPVPADYDGDGRTDVAIRRPSNSTWYILNSSNSNYNSNKKDGIQRVRFGLQNEDIPVPADYDGDGIADIAVRRPSTSSWFILNSSGSNFNSYRKDGIQRVKFGLETTDVPVPGDYDGDGIADIAIFRPTDSTWYVLNSSKSNFNSTRKDGIQRIRFGLQTGDIPVPADYDGDGITDVAIRRPSDSSWYIKNSTGSNYNSSLKDGIQRVKFGLLETDIPVPADYDGDGLADIAVRRGANQTFYILNTTDKTIQTIRFGEHRYDVAVNASVNQVLMSLDLALTAGTVSAPPNVIVIYTDDQGYADLGVQGQVDDVKTPNIDQLAHNGVRFTHAYVTSPQFTPSRAAMVTGQYQQRFGVDENKFTPIPERVETLGNRFKKLGYKTGMVGKWHLEVDGNSREWGGKNYPELVPFNVNSVPFDVRKQYFPDARGYDDTFFGFDQRYWTNFKLDGQSKDASYVNYGMYRLDAISKAATTFIDRNWDKPFYLHVAHYGPHVPLGATEKYLSRFPEDMPTRRRYALAMISAIDDGVGQIVATLERYQLLDNTMIFFISDNGAPLGDDMTDAPITTKSEDWDGSVNTPYIGEKGMLTEGGIRVPYIMQWPGHLNAGTVIDKPVSALDAAYTALKSAGETELDELDGVDLMPALVGQDEYLDNRPLFWRFYKQRAIRQGRWKYLQAGIKREYLFDMYSDTHENVNLIDQYPDIAESLRKTYQNWSAEMLRKDELIEIEQPFQIRYDTYLPPN